jgi:hypothetical protein
VVTLSIMSYISSWSTSPMDCNLLFASLAICTISAITTNCKRN